MKTKDSLDQESDEYLLSLYVNYQNLDALNVLFCRHMSSAYHIAYRYMKNQADSEDVVQKTFVNIMRFANKQNQPGMVKAWIMNSVINMSKNEIRQKVRQRKLIQNKPIIENETLLAESNETRELQVKIISAIDKLPDQYREPIWLTHYENMSVKEISHCLGKSENTIRSQLSRGLEKLGKILVGQGISMTSVSIIALLGESKKAEIVPPTLIQKIKAISALKNSARFSVTSVKPTSNFLVYLMSSFGVLLGIGICIYFWKYHQQVEIKNITVTTTANNQINLLKSSNQDLNLSFDFNSEKLPNWLEFQTSNFQIKNENKKEGFINILDKNDFILKLNIPMQNKPFKVAYDIKIKPIPDEVFSMYSLSQQNKKPCINYYFDNKLARNEWIHCEILIQHNVEALYYGGKLKLLEVYPFEFDTSHFIHLKGAIVEFDNIEIKTIEKSEIKDFSKCIELSKQYFKMGGKKTIIIPSPLPEIKKGDIAVSWGYFE